MQGGRQNEFNASITSFMITATTFRHSALRRQDAQISHYVRHAPVPCDLWPARGSRRAPGIVHFTLPSLADVQSRGVAVERVNGDRTHWRTTTGRSEST